MMRYYLTPTAERLRGSCPHCSQRDNLVIMQPEHTAPGAIQDATVVQCRACNQLSMPAGIIRRLGTLFVLGAFFALLTAGVVASMYFGLTLLDGGSAVLSGILFAASAAGLVTVTRAIRGLLQPDALLPLAEDFDGDEVLAGQF